jgi:polysaccharide biosynthesis/export protein
MQLFIKKISTMLNSPSKKNKNSLLMPVNLFSEYQRSNFSCLIVNFAVLLLLVLGAGCGSAGKLAYLNNLGDTTYTSLAAAQNIFESPIQKNDQLWITVGGTNAEDLVTLNSASGVIQGSAMGGQGGNAAPPLGYLVEADGTIKLPYLGKIKAEGLSRVQLENELAEKFKEYTKNPIVNVRFLNYRVTVLGAVKNPGSFSFSGERMTLLDALGLSGDLTNLGKRENVLVIREVNGIRSFGRINLLSKDVFTSPYYFLKTNDVVYVTPSQASSVKAERMPQYIGMATGILSLIITIIYVTK